MALAPQCPICGDTDVRRLDEPARQGYSMHACDRCDLEFADPLKNPGAEYYQELELYQNIQGVSDTLTPNQAPFFSSPHSPRGGTLLEIGFGAGQFLLRAREAGYSVYGVDFNPSFVRALDAELGPGRAFCASPEEFARKRPVDAFDTIAFFETLEHNEPRSFLREVKAMLKPRGHIALSVPNRERLVRDVFEPGGDDPPHHLLRFTARSLALLLRAEGFEPVELFARRLEPEDVSIVLRNKLRFNLSRLMRAPAAEAGGERPGADALPPAGRAAVRWKEKALDAAGAAIVRVGSPFFPKRWGVNLYCLARAAA